MSDMTIKFTQNRTIKNRHMGTKRETRYNSGDELSCSEGVAARWVIREAAEVVKGKFSKAVQEHVDRCRKENARPRA